MKQLLFLLLFPCFAMAQYQGNGNQKITLGEQTTADGLVWRGVENDTALITPFSDTSAYIILDTINNKFYNYNRSTNVWSLAGGGGGGGVTSFSAGTTGLTPSTATTGAVTLGGTLAVANGGTGSTTKNFVDLTTTQSIAGTKSFTSSTLNLSDNNGAAFANFGSDDGRAQYQYNNFGARTAGGYGWQFGRSASNGFLPDAYFIYNVRKNNVALGIDTNSNVGIGTNFSMPTERLHVVGNARITAVGALGGNSATLYRNSDGVLSTTSSDINKKHNVRPIIYGLETINQLNPVNFQWNVDESEDIGFIAQDIQNIIPESIETDWDSNLIFKYEKLIPILTKAIQEQQALIKALEQRILILENK